MHSFEQDRDVIVSLPAVYAKTVLQMLDNKKTRAAKAPLELKRALAAAQRCPDVARFFLVEKLQTHGEARR